MAIDHSFADILGESVCITVIFLYVPTGCDVVSQFQGRAKATVMKTWKGLGDNDKAFHYLIV